MIFEMVCVGVIAKPVGIKGQVKIHPYTSSPANLLSYRVFYLKDNSKITLKNPRINENGDIVTFIDGVSDRNAAELLHLKDIFIKKESLPPLEKDEYYLEDFSGLSIVNASKEILGTIIAALDYGAGVFFDVKLPDCSKIATLPFNKSSVLEIDLENKTIKIDEGFLLK